MFHLYKIMSTGKSIPIRCMIEVLVKDDQGCNGEAVEKESFAIVPSTTLFKDVVKTVLLKLGYSSQDISNAKGKYLLILH